MSQLIRPSSSKSHPEDRFDERAFLANAGVGMHSVDADGVIRLANRAAHEMLGLRAEEFIGQPIRQFHVNPAIVDRVFEQLSRAEPVRNIRSQLRCRDGSIRDVLINSSPVLEGGRLVATRCVTIDVTEEVRSSRVTLERASDYRALVDAAPVLIWMSDPNKNGVYFNRAWLEFTGTTLASQLGEGWLDAVHPDDREPLLRVCDSAYRDWKPFSTEFRLRAADGRYRWVLDHGAPRFDPSGAFAGFVGSCVDITPRKHAEERIESLGADLRHRAEELDALLRVLPVGVFVAKDITCLDMTTNPAGAEMLGIRDGVNPSKSSITGSSLPFRVLKDGVELSNDELPIQRAARLGEPVSREEIDIVRDDGGVRSLYINAVPLFDDADSVRGCVAAFVDISEKKASERALRESERRLATLVSNLPGAAFRCACDADWAAEFISDGVESITGYPALDFLKQRVVWASLVHADDLERLRITVEEALRDRRPFMIEYRIRRRDGAERWVWEQSVGVFDDDGEPIAIEGFVIDVTDRRRAEEARAYLATIVETSSDAVVSKTLDGVIRSWNKGAELLFGYSAEEAVGQSINLIIPQELWEEEKTILNRLRRGERIEHFDTERVAKNGRRLNVSLTISPVVDASGRIIGASKIARDISERKQSEQALRRSEERLRMALEAGRMGTWEWMIGANHVSWSPSLERIHGLEPGGFGGTLDDFKRDIHPEDQGKVEAAIASALEGPHDLNFEYRIVRPDGRVRWLGSSGRVIRDASGRPERMAGVCMDITDRKRIEIALRGSEARFRSMADAAPVLIWLSGPDKGCTWFNKQWTEFVGRPVEDEQGDGWTENVHPDDRKRCVTEYVAAFEAREPFMMEYRLRRHDGEYRWLLDHGTPLHDDDGAFQGYIGTCIDITDRRRHEERMRIVMAELNHRVKNTLAVVQSLLRQMTRRSKSFEEFKQSFESRLRAIADAHSLLTRSEWEGSSLKEILSSEIDTRVSSLDQRSLRGPAIVLPPASAIAMHMVVHELTTNACKYGALLSVGGRLDISWRIGDDHTLELVWEESSRNPVAAPAESGFGSQLIDQLIEYELQGNLTREFSGSGLRCEIQFPLDGAVIPCPTEDSSASKSSMSNGPRILVVEDNATLAMGLCDELRAIGFSPEGPAGTIEQAEQLAKKDDLDFVILDVDLKGETTLDLARQLQKRGVPFLLLTGYARTDLPNDLRAATIMTKPVNLDDMCAYLRKHHGSRP